MRRGPDLATRLEALTEALQHGEGVLPEDDLGPVRALLAKAGERRALGDATVVALAGATGSGKSTLFNALAGADLSTPGVRRPTTSTAHAATWGGEPGALLDWLEVPRRAAVGPDPSLDGLVLLDLPDHDSTRVEHRLEVDRLVEVVDVLVWVLDPQKYADAAVHDRYLRPYASHARNLLVVLNQADRLEDPRPVEQDLRGLLDREGLERTRLLVVSGRTGLGLDALRAELAERVRARRAATDRLAADAQRAARRLQEHCGPDAGEVDRATRARLVDALADAAGVPVVTSAVRRSTVARVRRHTAWPLLRWTRGLRADPLERLHLEGGGRTSLAPAGEVEQARVGRALRDTRDAVAAQLPTAWRESVRARLEERRLAPALDRAVARTELRAERTPVWARAVGVLQWLLLAAAVVGAVWLLGLIALEYLQIEPPVPQVEGLPVPTVLLVLGLLAGFLVGALARPVSALTGRRRAARAQRLLHRAVGDVAEVELLAPLREQRQAYGSYCAAVERAAA